MQGARETCWVRGDLWGARRVRLLWVRKQCGTQRMEVDEYTGPFAYLRRLAAVSGLPFSRGLLI